MDFIVAYHRESSSTFSTLYFFRKNGLTLYQLQVFWCSSRKGGVKFVHITRYIWAAFLVDAVVMHTDAHPGLITRSTEN